MSISDADLAALGQAADELLGRSPTKRAPTIPTPGTRIARVPTESAPRVDLRDRTNLDILLDTESFGFETAMEILADRQMHGWQPAPKPKPESPRPPGLTLDEAIAIARPKIADSTKTTKVRTRLLWAAAKQARALGAAKDVHMAFMRLAVETGLIDRGGWWTGADINAGRRRYGRQDIDHVVSWALRGLNPFEK